MSKAGAALSLLQRIANDHAPAVFASSLGAEDMVLTDLIARHELPIGVFTLDTGRLHGDTLDLMERVRYRYGIAMQVWRPEASALDRFAAAHRPEAIYGSVEIRMLCCAIRKREPLARALAGKAAWITGLRRAQSQARAAVELQEFDKVHGMPKFNPLAGWSEAEVWDYIREYDVPCNPLHAQGYRSIGCAPCTRPVLPGEDARLGRWWWESGTARECGLHLTPDGRLVRAREAA